MKKFIITTDKPTAERLIAEGFNIVSVSNKQYVFINKPIQLAFLKRIDNSKLAFTDMLNL